MKTKISFPKGSLKFVNLNTIPKDPRDPRDQPEMPEDTPPDFQEYYKRKKFALLMEKNFPHKVKQTLPGDLRESIVNNNDNMRYARQYLKEIKVNDFKNDYQVTFKHPKWFPIVGAIVINSEKQNIKETMMAIAKEFRIRKDDYRRNRLRQKKIMIKSLQTNITYNVSGGCIYMPHLTQGVFIKFLKDQERKIVFAPKFPKEANEKYVGVELEFLAPIDKEELGGKLYDAGMGRFVTLKEDHSIKCSHGNYPNDCHEHRGVEFAHELCVIATEGQFKDVITTICKLLNEVKCTVNKTCGMHVHLDCRNRDAEKVYQNLISAQNILLRMNPKSRIEKYAKQNKERDFKIAMTQGGAGNGGMRIDEGRYYAINAKAFNTHKTIEVRVHAGTVDLVKITNWVSMLVSIGSTVERYVRSFNTIPTFCKRFGIDASIHTYIQERIDKFKIVIDAADREIVPEAEQGVA